ncbi:hypothetical protein TNCT_388301 [Trichonephila clavata]|uniref:Uncharacterized protein n=1 Tax=Trichonephila clavata TaxID=2740835 RepID=A0A8X6LWM1_TRICU|nr:hypothetical protein TNCT_388301 [Trichonephila clavata]
MSLCNTLSRLLLKPGSPPHPGARVAQSPENQHSKDLRWTSIMEPMTYPMPTKTNRLPKPSPDDLYQELRPSTDCADPCKMQADMESVIAKALIHRNYYQQSIDIAQRNPVSRDEDLIIQRRKDIAAVNILMERLRDELASSYPCPNPDCHAHNKIPDLTSLENAQLTWHHTNTTHKTNNPPTTNNLSKKTNR